MRATPMLEQYWALKREAGDALLLYRLGDFYEMFFEDAAYAAPLLGLVLTARHKDSDVEAPMCGIPQHALEPYLAKLVAAGRKVAISEQTEAPAKGRTLVARKIVRIVTPGTIVDPERLDARRPNEMAAVTWNGDGAAVSTLDLSTGDFAVVKLPDRAALTEWLLRRVPPELVVFPSDRTAAGLPVGSPAASGGAGALATEGQIAAGGRGGGPLEAALPHRDARAVRPDRRGRGRRRGGGVAVVRAGHAARRLRPRALVALRGARRRARRRRRDRRTPRAVPRGARRRPEGDTLLAPRSHGHVLRCACPPQAPRKAARPPRRHRSAARWRRGAPGGRGAPREPRLGVPRDSRSPAPARAPRGPRRRSEERRVGKHNRLGWW